MDMDIRRVLPDMAYSRKILINNNMAKIYEVTTEELIEVGGTQRPGFRTSVVVAKDENEAVCLVGDKGLNGVGVFELGVVIEDHHPFPKTSRVIATEWGFNT